MTTEPQHLDDIVIPDIEIQDGWPVSEVATIEDCDDAYSLLMAAVAEIEYELELKDLGVCKFADPMWPARARRALKYKRAALQMVGYKRGRIMEDRRRALQNTRDQEFMDHIKSLVPALQFHQWVMSFSVGRIEEAA